MEAWKRLCSILIIVLIIECGEAQLSENFYSRNCPQVETVVRQAVLTKFSQTFATASSTLHLFFHDCFVQGCDASVLIFSPNGDAEKDAQGNLSMGPDGFDTVTKAKQAVEAVCPGVVSCADILALATRDVVVLTGGPYFKVELGRRDGLESKASEVPSNLPKKSFNLTQLVSLFSKHNLTQTDMIALSGAHTLGFTHCSKITDRIYNFSSSTPTDPSLNPAYVRVLKRQCPPNVDPTTVLPMDPQTPRKFDNLYFRELLHGRGMFASDQVLFADVKSRDTVVGFANSPREFNKAFVTAMKKLGRVGVKTGSLGEIRRDCQAFNS